MRGKSFSHGFLSDPQSSRPNFLQIRENPRDFAAKNLDLLLRKLDFQSQRVSESIGKVGQARQQMNVDDLRF